MLGKLMKYEWKATWKLLVSANAFMLVMTMLAWCMIKMLEHSEDIQMFGFIAVLLVATYVGSIFAVCVGTTIYLIHRFYTSTYGDQGYLLHTLPVDTHHIIVAKGLVSAAWELINIVVVYVSVLVLIISVSDFDLFYDNAAEIVRDTVRMLGADKITAFTVIMALIAYVFSLLAEILKVGACISLGQLSANHKLMLSFAWYIGIYVVEQIIQTVYFAIVLAFQKRLSDTSHFYYFDSQWETTLIAGILSCVVFYLLTWYVMSRKLNLE